MRTRIFIYETTNRAINLEFSYKIFINADLFNIRLDDDCTMNVAQ